MKPEEAMKIYTDEERQNHVRAWEASGLSRSAYAREQGVSTAALCKWVVSTRQKGAGFVELPQARSYQGRGEITIARGDIEIRLPEEMLETVLRLLGISGRKI
jgi:transposase-like protein